MVVHCDMVCMTYGYGHIISARHLGFSQIPPPPHQKNPAVCYAENTRIPWYFHGIMLSRFGHTLLWHKTAFVSSTNLHNSLHLLFVDFGFYSR